MAHQPEHNPAGGSVQHLNPNDLPKNKAYTRVVSVSGAVKTIYVGGQDAVTHTAR